jgi:hypothetical protein
MRLGLGERTVLKAASWRVRNPLGRWKKRGWIGFRLGSLAVEIHLRPSHYRRDAERLTVANCWSGR